MIRTKFLVEGYDRRSNKAIKGIDEMINDFIDENQHIEIIDIKYQSNVSTEGYFYGYDTSALIIYREPEKYISRLGIEFGEEDDEQR